MPLCWQASLMKKKLFFKSLTRTDGGGGGTAALQEVESRHGTLCDRGAEPMRAYIPIRYMPCSVS